MAHNKRGQGRDDLFDMLKAVVTDLGKIKADLASFKAKYEDHRHSVAGAASTGTKPSTGGAAADATASTVTVTFSSVGATTE